MTRDKAALVDDADYELVSRYKWYLHSTGYAVRNVKVGRRWRKEFLHRFLMGLKSGDGLEVDHANRDRLDNRRENLRVVTPADNRRNQSSRGHSKHRKKHRARIYTNGKEVWLGTYDDPRMARAAYLCAKQIFHPIGGKQVASTETASS